MFAFLLSLVLVAVNIGQIITILVPLINEHASPDHNYRASEKAKRMKCGFGAETTAVSVHHFLKRIPGYPILAYYSVVFRNSQTYKYILEV